MAKKFVEVVVKATKEKQMVPEHFLEHPEFGEQFTSTPKARAAAKKAAAPRAAKKTAARKTAAKKTAAASPAADKTPATGDDKEN